MLAELRGSLVPRSEEHPDTYHVFSFGYSNGGQRVQAEAKHEPTLEEIATACAKIREGWSEKDHWIRMGYPNGPPLVEVTQARDRSNK